MLSIKSLRIDYEQTTAVADLSLEITKGQVFGLVGPNGAGKTSTIKALAGVLEPTYGEIKINGIDLELEHEKALLEVGYMPDFPPVYENLKVWEYCDCFAAAYLLGRDERAKRVKHWIERVNLTSKWDSYVRDLSRGMRQRLVLAKTLIPNPSVLLLDEPASGLDPLARRELRDLIKAVAMEGMTVVISSHILTELSEFCNAIGIMEKGRMVVAGSIEDIRKRIGAKGELQVRLLASASVENKKLLKEILSTTPFLSELKEEQGNLIRAVFSGNEEDAAKLLHDLTAKNLPISNFHIKEENVEDIFFKVNAKEVS